MRSPARLRAWQRLVVAALVVVPSAILASTVVEPDNENLQFFGRWDFSDPKAPRYDWTGVYVQARFTGTGIGVMLNDSAGIFDVFIDDGFPTLLKCTQSGVRTHALDQGLEPGVHTLLLTRGNVYPWDSFSFHGLVLDDGAVLVEPPAAPARKIEFVGDSYVCGTDNRLGEPDYDPENPNRKSTDSYYGFAAITARHFGAQYHLVAFPGKGIVTNADGGTNDKIPLFYDRTLLTRGQLQWDFISWKPHLVVLVGGINDDCGFCTVHGSIPEAQLEEFKSGYHEFLAVIRENYAYGDYETRILTVAPNSGTIPWLEEAIMEVVAKQERQGHYDVFYEDFPWYSADEYFDTGHPRRPTHEKIAQRLINAIEKIPNCWNEGPDMDPPMILTAGPSGTVCGSGVELTATTNERSRVRWSLTDIAYSDMTNQFASGESGFTHSTGVEVDAGAQVTLFVRAQDLNGNSMDTSATMTFTFLQEQDRALCCRMDGLNGKLESGTYPYIGAVATYSALPADISSATAISLRVKAVSHGKGYGCGVLSVRPSVSTSPAWTYSTPMARPIQPEGVWHALRFDIGEFGGAVLSDLRALGIQFSTTEEMDWSGDIMVDDCVIHGPDGELLDHDFQSDTHGWRKVMHYESSADVLSADWCYEESGKVVATHVPGPGTPSPGVMSVSRSGELLIVKVYGALWESARVTVYSVAGRRLLTGQLSSGARALDLSCTEIAHVVLLVEVRLGGKRLLNRLVAAGR